jgi:DNA-directed RNA polymerase specialized sigma24 family protein
VRLQVSLYPPAPNMQNERKMPTEPDPPVPSNDLKAVTRQVFAYAEKLARGRARDSTASQDIAQHVLASITKPNGYGALTTDREREKFRLNKVRGLVYEEIRKARTHAMTGMDLDAIRDHKKSQETMTAYNDLKEKLRADLKGRLEGDRLAIALVDITYAEGVDEPGKQAKELKVPPNAVRAAWRRIRGAVDEFLGEAGIKGIALAEGPPSIWRTLFRDQAKVDITYVGVALDAIQRRGDLPERPSPKGKAKKDDE